MRRTATTLLLCSVLIAASATAPSGAAAQETPGTSSSDLPAGFTDGQPVGGTELPASDVPVKDGSAPAPAPGNGSTLAASTTTRYFGQGPWDAINAATTATPRCTGLAAPDLTAMVVSPVFKESSAATSPSSAPAPMTLGRYDEWNGVYATTSNHSANYGLYAFRDPYTVYPRAYWHAGIGIWQYDSAGVGAPYTALERMDVRTAGGDVAAGMAARYCNPPTAVVGHGAPFTDQERRDAAWWPWWSGSSTRSCPLCQAEFDNMTASTPYFANVSLVAGISATGGAVKRTCTLGGATLDCWYVNPSVGVIEGSTGWTGTPDGNGSPTVAPSPLSKPFYVVKRNGYEERHWLKVDSGYNIDISGKRLLGKNERPRSDQPGSGVTWASTSGLCDVTTGRGSCAPVPPTNPAPPTNPVPAPSGVPVRSTTASVGGTYRPIPLDANGDGKGDILWYAPGSAGDYLWLGRGSGTFTSVPISINGTYDDVVVLNADGDGRDDLLFNARSTGASYLWRSRGDGTFTSTPLYPGAGRAPLVGSFDPTGADDIFWYGPGRVGDALWTWTGSGYNVRALTVDGVFSPFVGDFDRNGTDDIFWYGPGAAPDRLWLHKRAGGYVSQAITVNGTYRPIVGDYDGNGGDDILWYGAGSTPDTVWFSTAAGAFASQSLVVNETYVPVVADLEGDGRDDVVWHAPNKTTDLWTRWATTRARSSISLSVNAPHIPFAGAFSAGGGDGIFWYAAGSTTDAIWWR